MIQSNIDKVAEMTSLALTSPTLISAAIVIYIWFPAFVRAFKAPSKSKTAQQWLILGVATSFIGGFFDNLWWGSAWARFYLMHDSWHWWFSNGVYSNIPFRQVAGILAAYCHIKSAFAFDGSDDRKFKLINKVLLIVTVLSLVIWGSLKV